MELTVYSYFIGYSHAMKTNQQSKHVQRSFSSLDNLAFSGVSDKFFNGLNVKVSSMVKISLL